MWWRFKTFGFIAPTLLVALFSLFGPAPKSSALSGSDFISSRIIDDSVFFNGSTMNPTDIQAVLNAKVPVCDTNGTQPSGRDGYPTRADWGRANGENPPYTCLKDYSQTINGSSADAYCGGSVGAGTKSAAQIIYEVSQACNVNPKVLIVLLQKEQSLVTDEWPWSTQYRSATGYGCPDTAPCDAQYYGFFNQVYNAARQFQRYAKLPDQYNYASGRTSYVQYNPNAACGGGNIYMQNQATAGLYNYTPYQPNAAALSNLYGTGDSCSAYGNRNFWRLYIDWFGSPISSTPWAWLFEGQETYSDSARSRGFTSVPTASPGEKIYVRVKARNMGTETWNQSFVRLGTSRPMDRVSAFFESGWISNARAASLKESSVTPGQIGTFEFALQAPSTLGTYNEYFNVLAEGRSWLNDLGLFFSVNVNNAASASNSIGTTLNGTEELHRDDYVLSSDAQSALALQRNGNLALYSNFKLVWETGTQGRSTGRLVMQSDGNLVLYDGGNSALWSAQTNGNSGAWLQINTDGNMVVYRPGNTPAWATYYTIHNPDHLSYVNTAFETGLGGIGRIYPGQQIETADRRFKLVLQRDGNLVLYSPTRALWSTGTNGQETAFLAIQPDGNLVLYDRSARALWASHTTGYGLTRLIMQPDGNLVIYKNPQNVPLWHTGTAGAS